MEFKDLDPRNWLKKTTASAGGDVPPGNITAVANAEDHEPNTSGLVTMTVADAEKAVPPTTGVASAADLKNTKVMEAVKTTSDN